MSESDGQFPYFMPDEVVLHNRPEDCWLSCLGGVYDLTEYVTRNSESIIGKYLLGHAGRDVSHWFQDRRFRVRGEGRRRRRARLKRYVDVSTGLRPILLPFVFPVPEGGESKSVPRSPGLCPCGCPGCPRREPDRERDSELTGKCWLELERIFNGGQFQVGRLTKKARPCRITNVLTGQRTIIWVCEEDSIERIQERALLVNGHGASYTWKFEGKPLDPARTLTENGIGDERDRYLAAGLPDDPTTYVPNLLCYYNDDLTEM